jgi:phosphatidylethanolamine/phosphatidyl-N-methylethanolamine N-methyltransferase
MSAAILFKRFLARPFQVAYIFPSSQTLVRRVASKCDFSQPRIIVELGPGEGVHTREILRRMHPDSRLFLIELDPVLAEHVRREFASDPRVEVITTDAAQIRAELTKRGIDYCDYVISGIPFSMFDVPTKRRILNAVYEALAPTPLAAFVIYQCTHELKKHATMFPRVTSEYCLFNLPPIFVTVYHKQALNAPKEPTEPACCQSAHTTGVN